MDLINTTDIQANETNVNWYEDGEAANAAVLNRPTKQVAEKVNEVITKLQDNEVTVGLNAGETNQGLNAIAIGENAGQTDQPANTIAIGLNATPVSEGDIVIQTTSNVIEVTADGMTVNGNRVGGGGSTLSTPVIVDTLLEAGEGCLVDTGTAATEVVITLSAGPKAGEEHIVGDFSNFETGGSANLYPIKIIPNPADALTTIDGDTAFYIDKDGAKITFNYNEADNNWELSAGFNEGSSPKAIYNRTESVPPVGTTVFNVTYTVGYVDVLLNGTELDSSEFTATDGSTITLAQPTLAADDVVVIKAYILIDKIEDVTYTRKEWSGTALTGATSLPATGLENDVAKAYRLVIGGVLQQPTADYTISSATNEVLLTEALDGDYKWYLLAEAQVQLFVAVDSSIDATNTNNTLTGTTVKDNIDQLDAKVESKTDYNQNLLINADFSVNQRAIDGALTTDDYAWDRWVVAGNGTVGGTVTLASGKTSEGSYGQLTVATATGAGYILQRIEENLKLQGKTITFSAGINHDVAVSDAKIYAIWKTTAGVDSSSAAEVSFASVSGDSELEVSFVCPTITSYSSANEYMLEFVYYYGGETTSLDGIYQFKWTKLEVSAKATSYVRDLAEINLGKCQRFYEQSLSEYPLNAYGSTATSNTSCLGVVRFHVEKRQIPSMSWENLNTTGAGTLVFENKSQFGINAAASSSTAAARIQSWIADSEL